MTMTETKEGERLVLCCTCGRTKKRNNALKVGGQKFICMGCHAFKFPNTHVSLFGAKAFARDFQKPPEMAARAG